MNSDDFLDFNTLDCLDRIVITGTSRDFGWESAMRKYCFDRDIDKEFLAAWARPHTEAIRAWAEEAACASNEPMIDCNRYKGRKDDFVKKAIQESEKENARWWSYVDTRLRAKRKITDVLTGEDYISGAFADYIDH